MRKMLLILRGMVKNDHFYSETALAKVATTDFGLSGAAERQVVSYGSAVFRLIPERK